MDPDGDKNNQKFKKQRTSNDDSKRSILDVGTFFQSIWIRCSSIFSYIVDRKFMESELCFVLYCGVFLWVIFLLFQTFK